MTNDNVFGIPVTQGSRLEMAQTAYNDQNADGKRDEALEYVRKEKEKYGNGSSTLCIFYNATGEELIHFQDFSIFGKIYDAYPNRVQNGQWGAFLHVKTAVVPSGSVGFVVYRGKYNDTSFCNQLLGWDTPWDQITQNNHAYCNIFDNGYVDSPDVVYKKMERVGRQHVALYEEILLTEANTEEASSPLYEAILSLEHFSANKNIICVDAVDAEKSSA